MGIIETIFWVSIFAVVYAYFGYIAALWFLALVKTNKVKKEDITPSVSLVISVYNEENVLAEKIENALELDCSKHSLEIAIISDGSTDGSVEIIRKYEKVDNRIRSFIFSTNKGKTACLNEVVPELKGELLLFSDANSFYGKDTLTKIARSFADENIGFITGSTKYYSHAADQTIEATSLYSRLERFTKIMESRIGSCVGADGAIFAIRKHLYRTLGPYDMNDFGVPLSIVRRGFRGIIDPKVYCKEETASSIQSEFRRQVRITSRTLRAIFNYSDLLNPFKFGLFSFQLFSHKLLKLLVPLFILLLFLSNIILVFMGGYFYHVCLCFQIMFYSNAFLRWSVFAESGIKRLFIICRSFIFINAAIFLGWISYLSGETYTTWQPEKR